MEFSNCEKVLGDIFKQHPVTTEMFEALLKDLAGFGEKQNEKIVVLEKRVSELEDLWLSERKLPEKLQIPKEKITKAPRKPRVFYQGADTMDDEEKNKCAISIFEEVYRLFKMTFPGIKQMTSNVGGITRYVYQNDEGRIWKGLNEFWPEYEEWVQLNKPKSEYEGAVRRPQYRKPQTI